jgi:hypothetical protein
MKTNLSIIALILWFFSSTNVHAQSLPVAKVCKDATSTSDDIRKQYLDVLLSENKITFKTSYLSANTPITFTNLLFKCTAKDPKCISQEKIKLNLTSLLFFGSKYYKLEWNGPFKDVTKNNAANGTASTDNPIEFAKNHPDKTQQKIETFLDLSSPYYKLSCTKLALDQTPNRPSRASDNNKPCDPKKGDICPSSKNISIVKNTKSIGKKLSKKESAEIALSIDKAKKVEVKHADGSTSKEDTQLLSANIAFIYEDLFNAKNRKDKWEGENRISDLTPSVSPFVQLEYKSNFDAQKETDNLSFGVGVNGFFLPAHESNQSIFAIGEYRFRGSWITDIEERESSQWLAELNVPLIAIDHSQYPAHDRLNWGWFLVGEVALDYSNIGDVGDKIKLEKLSSFNRYGYDVRFTSRIGYGLDQWSATLSADYKFRDDFTSKLANADIWEVGLSLKPSDDSKLSYGVKYKNGENLTSLEDLESWQFTLGYKR